MAVEDDVDDAPVFSGSQIRAIREGMKLSQKEFGRRLGLTKPGDTVHFLESDAKRAWPPLCRAMQLIQAIDRAVTMIDAGTPRLAWEVLRETRGL